MKDCARKHELTLGYKGGHWSAKDISEQPEMWSTITSFIDSIRKEVNRWLQPVLSIPNLRIILTGSGASALTGKTLAVYMQNHLGISVETINNADIVSNPKAYFRQDIPTLLITYSRSGNKPEAITTCELAERLLSQCYHLVITFNEFGHLAEFSNGSDNRLCILLPNAKHDIIYTKASSFTSMILASLYIFEPDKKALESVRSSTKQLIEQALGAIHPVATLPYGRIVFLGSSVFSGITKGAALYMQVCCEGKVDSYAYSPIGFQHGPKSLVDNDTLIILLPSNIEYTQRYDQDIKNQLVHENQSIGVIDVSEYVNGLPGSISDIWLTLPYMVFCQILVFYKSIAVGAAPDTPYSNEFINPTKNTLTIHSYKL